MFLFLKDVVRTFCIFSFLFFLDTLFLHCDIKPCTLIDIYIYIYWGCYYILSPISSCVVSFLFLCTCFLLIVCNLLYFCFTLRYRDKFCLKCFRNIGCQSLSCHEIFSYKVFQEFVFGLDFIVFNKWAWVEWFMTSLICSFVCYGFVTDCQRRRLLGHMWIKLGTYVI